MRPYYEADGVTIYHGDCREILPQVSAADLVLTDPPFFMPAQHYQSRAKWQRQWGDTSILATFWEVVTEVMVGSLRKTGHLLTFCNHESYPVFYPVMSKRVDFLKALVWNNGRVGLGRVWRNQFELVIAARWETSTFYEDGKLRADVLCYEATRTADRDHPVQKPVALLADLVKVTTPADGLVVDPFMGSGTTLVAARDLCRRAIGIEIEERYCEIAAQRLAQMVMDFGSGRTAPQPDVFDRESTPTKGEAA